MCTPVNHCFTVYKLGLRAPKLYRLNLRWAHMSEDTFSDVAANMIVGSFV